jgi:RNA polymerase-binding protein DksA
MGVKNMTRRNALLRLHQDLLARRYRLARKLAGELAHLHDGNAGDATGDNADLAFEADGDEISSRLAELGDKELMRIEEALDHWLEGTFGICESCQKPISLVRLKALPVTLFCISCERELEKFPDGETLQGTAKWRNMSDAQAALRDERMDVSELERNLFGSRFG